MTITATPTPTSYYAPVSTLGNYYVSGDPLNGYFTTGIAGLAVSVSGSVTTLFVSDGGDGLIQTFDFQTQTWSIYLSGLNTNWGIALDPSGNLWVANGGAGQVLKYTGTTPTTVSSGGQFVLPGGLCSDTAGNIYVADIFGDNIQVYNAVGSSWSTLGGYPGPKPYGVAVDSSNNAYVADYTDNYIYKYNGSSWSAFAGSGGTHGSTGGQTQTPFGVAVDSHDNVYEADYSDFVNMYDPSGNFKYQFLPYAGSTLMRCVMADSLGDVFMAQTNSPMGPIDVYPYVP